MLKQRVVVGLMLVGMLVGAAGAVFADDPGFALKFDGVSDLVRFSTTSSMMAATWTTTKSVSLWVKPTGSATCTTQDPGGCDVIFGDKPRSWGISRGTVGGLDRIWVWNYDGTTDRVGIPYVAGEWIQVALVQGAGTLSAYKNGLLVGSVASGATVPVSGQVLHIGGIINNAAKNWTLQGEIDEVQLWNTARSASEIYDNTNHSLIGNEIGLAAYYKMSNGAGSTVTDDSGHSWTGTLVDGGTEVPPDGPITWVASGAFGAGGIPNNPPVANGQTLSTPEDTPLPLTLTGSDPDPGDTLTFRVVNQPAHGGLSGTAPALTYTPSANYNGPDSFTFVANDSHIDSAPATVSLTITPVNDAPVAVADNATTPVNTAVLIPVLSNDYDVDLDTVSIDSFTTPAHGVVGYDQNQLLYTPETGFTGSDAFDYTAADGHGGFANTTVTVTVRPAGPDPGFALRFDGLSDYVRLSTTISMMAPTWTTTKTASLWVKPTGAPSCTFPEPASCDAIFGDRPRWWGISRGVVGGLDRIWVYNYSGQLQAIGIPYTANEWVHISLVHGGGMLSAYKNGVLVGSVASGATLQPMIGGYPVLQIGGIINTPTRNWTLPGEIDEVQIWNLARTAQEIAQDLAGPLTGAENGLAAYYQMSDGSGATLTDNSGHGWTGTLQDGGGIVPPDGPILWVPSGAFVIP